MLKTRIQDAKKKYPLLDIDLLSETTKRIRSKIGQKAYDLQSELQYIGGKGNLGFILHTRRSEPSSRGYITKITRNNRLNTRKEIYFYDTILPRSTGLKRITPDLIDITSFENEDLCFLTLELIIGHRPKEDNILQVMQAYHTLTSVVPERIDLDYLDRDKGFQLQNISRKFTMHTGSTFTSIHKEKTNEEIMDWLLKQAASYRDHREVNTWLRRLESIVIGSQLYSQMTPAQDFVFQHGDFGFHNMFIDSAGFLYLYDWRTYKFGPPGYDLALYCRKKCWSFEKIEALILSHPETDRYLRNMDKAIFLYALIVMRFVDGITNKVFSSPHSEFIKPAVERLERLIHT